MTQSFDMLLEELQSMAAISLVTALRYDAGKANRIYSSDPGQFPNRGSKSFADAPTMAQVRRSAAPVLTEGEAAIKRGFADWPTILSNECDAVVNLPVRLPSGHTVGQLNLFGNVGAFPETTLLDLQTIADRYAMCFRTEPSKGVQ